MLLLMLLSACAARVQGGNEHSVIVGPAGESSAFSIASEHCAKYGKKPRLSGHMLAGSRYFFDCI